MKKLLVIGLFIACNLNLDALQTESSTRTTKIGQLCGDDNCQCPDHKKPEQAD
jgi:hypothetical protein